MSHHNHVCHTLAQTPLNGPTPRVSPRRWLIVLGVIFFAGVGCKVWEPVELEEVATTIRGGDVVRVRTEAGREVVFEVQSIDATALVGEDERVPIVEITQIDRQRLGFLRTFFLSLGIGSILVVSVVAIAAVSLVGAT